MNENIKNNIFKYLSISTILLMIAIFLSYVRCLGYFSYFSIDYSLIFFDNISSFIYLGGTSSAIAFLFVGSILLITLYSESEEQENNETKIHPSLEKFLNKQILCFKNIKIGTVLYILIGPIGLFLLHAIFYNFILKIEFSLIINFFYTTFDSAIAAIYLNRNKIFKDKFMKKMIWTSIILAFVMSVIEIYFNAGYNEAKNKRQFWTTEDNTIIIYNTNDKGIFCPYEQTDGKKIKIDNTTILKKDLSNIKLNQITIDEINFKQ